MIFKKISNKIFFFYSILICFLIGFLVFIFSDVVSNTHHKIIKREMVEKVNFIEHVLNKKSSTIRFEKNKIEELVEEISSIINLRITIVNYSGHVIADSKIINVLKMDNHKDRQEIMDAFANGEGESVRYSSTLKRDMFYYARKYKKNILRLAKPIDEIDEFVAGQRKIVIYSSIILFVSALFLVFIVTKKITRPINETIAFARDFSHGDLSKRIISYSDDEIGSLQKSLNKLADIIVDKINNLVFEQNKLHLTINSIHDGIAVINNNKKIILCNDAFLKFLNIDSVWTDRFYYEVIRNSLLNVKIEDTLQVGGTLQFSEEFYNGKYCEVIINPIVDSGLTKSILIVLYDKTEKKKIEQIKTDLVGNLSHELKTPITILRGYIETVLQNLEKREMVMDFLEKSLQNVDRQNSIINDILKLNRIETTNDFTDEKVNLSEVIGNCIDILKPKSEKKEVIVKYNKNLDDSKISGNKFLVEEVIFNLIDNAINYNKAGGSVDITVKQEDSLLKCTILDTGIGIPDDSIDRIFERFYRVDKGRSRSTGGTGLGLSIVKHAADVLEWDISVEHNKPEGSVFIIKIMT